MRLVQHSEIVQGQSDIRVVGFEDFLFNDDRAPVQPFGFPDISVRLMQRGEVVQVNCDVVVFPAEEAYESSESMTV